MERRIVEVLGDWDKDKPTHGTRRPREAVQVLSSYEERFTKVREDRENMVRAKNALDMTDTLRVGTQSTKLDVAMEELADLRGNLFNAFFVLKLREKMESKKINIHLID